jgi:6-phosphogluconolactonase (cycloisomerase 2 family)
VNPNGLYAYVVNYNSGTITEYTITNGALAFLTTQSTGTNSYPASIALTSTGTYAYVAGGYFNTGPGTVYEYQVVNGALQPLTASPTIATGDEPNEIVVDPLNRFAWVVNYFDGTVSAYTIGTNGALQLTGTVSADANSNSRCGGNGCAASSITIDATGQNAYVTNRSAGTIWQYAINQTNGTLTKLNIVNVGTGTEPSWLAIDPSGQYAYVTERVAGGSTIAEYSITGGALTPLPQATVQSSGTEPVSIFTAR